MVGTTPDFGPMAFQMAYKYPQLQHHLLPGYITRYGYNFLAGGHLNCQGWEEQPNIALP